MHKEHKRDLRILTLVTKWMGSTSDEWKRHFELAKMTGYNAVHLTPFQERGMSNSPYSLRNHHEIDPQFFSEFPSRLEELKNILHYAKENLGLLIIVDVVWNHVSCDTPWISEQPDAGYNLENSPHLRIAYELDESLMNFSELKQGYEIKEETDIDTLLDEFRKSFYEGLMLWEYFVIDIDGVVSSLRGKEFTGFEIEYQKQWSRKPFRVKIRNDINQQKKTLEDLRMELENENLKHYQVYDSITEQIFSNLKDRLIYERLSPHGPKLGQLSRDQPMQPTYFTRTQNGHALANNGWIWNANPLVNFAQDTVNLPYLTRSVIIWGDCVKLRFKNRFALEYMQKYTDQMAELFNGFRIDNCHSTPIKVAKRLLTSARAVNPKLIVVAELFTGSYEAEKVFERELCIDYLIREAMVEDNAYELAAKASEYSASPLGQVFSKQSDNKNIFYDCTHDNPMPGEKRTIIDTLSNSAIVAFSGCGAVGSVRGYDELNPRHLNIVTNCQPYGFSEQAFMRIKHEIYQLRERMNAEACTEMVAFCKDEVVYVQRINPVSMSGYCLVANSAFSRHQTKKRQAHMDDKYFDNELLISFIPKIFERSESQGRVGLNCSVNELRLENSKVVMPAGSIAAFKMSLKGQLRQVISKLESMNILELFYKAMSEFDLGDYNEVFFKCGQEEIDSYQRDVYHIPGFGDLPFAGFGGLDKLVEMVERRRSEDHPLIKNLRGGFWLLDYHYDRLLNLRGNEKMEEFIRVYDEIRELIKTLPVEYSAKYVLRLVKDLNLAMKKSFIDGNCEAGIGGKLEQTLAINVVKLCGRVPSTGLFMGNDLCLSAGLPHFSTHHMRCWGRDVFISFHGIFMQVLKKTEANRKIMSDHLIAFAQSEFNGLIPNLLDCQRYPRYNARDATWFFLNSLLEYAAYADMKILKMRFEDDRTMSDIIKEILSSHWNGIEFREKRAGLELDTEMKDEGFNIKITCDHSTGLIYGGNESNCGTWMDKMGSAPSNKGIPGTSRHGANIEINALVYKALKNISQLKMDFDVGFLEFVVKWKDLIKQSFEPSFYHQKWGYYKDTLDSDVSLRPNQLIAMAEAPELFDRDHAIQALDLVLEKLLDIGVRTLPVDDPRYRPIYDNSLCVGDPSIDHGANYHNGPQWLWLLGPLYRSLKNFGHQKTSFLREHIERLVSLYEEETIWGGLPELLNGDGTRNGWSCHIQTWSVAQVLQVLLNDDDNYKVDKK